MFALYRVWCKSRRGISEPHIADGKLNRGINALNIIWFEADSGASDNNALFFGLNVVFLNIWHNFICNKLLYLLTYKIFIQ